MSKIQTIHIKNFKAITEQYADFKGCSAIVTGGNNKGKSSFLRGVIDRVRFVRPDLKVRAGEKEGRGELVLDTGDKFVWDFDDAGKDKLTFIDIHGVKANVTKEFGAQFFPPLFDIDKFLNSTPKSQVEQLQKIVGIDFTDVDNRYQKAYDFRTARNQDAERYHAKISKAIKVDPVTAVNMEELNLVRASMNELRRIKADELNALYKKNQAADKELRDKWEAEKKKVDEEISDFNADQFKKEVDHNNATLAAHTLFELGLRGMDRTVVEVFVLGLKDLIKPTKKAADHYPIEPKYSDPIDAAPLKAIDEEIAKIDAQIASAMETNDKARQYREYRNLYNEVEEAQEAATQADIAVKIIEQERKEMIEKAKFPTGISISSGKITVDGFDLDRQVISTSKLYIAALRIASMNLGEVRSMHFDASFLDNNSLAEVADWAEENDLQLLIERPDYAGGEIRFELIEG